MMLPVAPILRVIRPQSSKVVGTAFATPMGIATCSHVVAAASDAPKLSGPSEPEGLDASVARRGQSPQPIDDWAILSVSHLAEPKTLPISSAVIPGHPFTTFGYPTNWEEMGNHARGTIGAANASGLYELVGDPSGFRIRPGFSGAPVWDDIQGAVVGIVVGSDAQLDQRVAFMIPMRCLKEIEDENNTCSASFGSSDLERIASLSDVPGSKASILRYLLQDRLPQLGHDAVSRYWVYLAVAEIGGSDVSAKLRDAVDRETHPFAKRGAKEALKLIDT